MIIKSLFPTAVGRFNINRTLLDTEWDFIMETSENVKDQSINKFHLSKNKRVLDDPRFFELRRFIEKSVKSYVNEVYKPKNQVELYITESWLNYMNDTDVLHLHNHPNSFLSGVFYPKTPDSCYLTFIKNDYDTIMIEPEKYNDYNCYTWKEEIKEGDLLIFPSKLSHNVDKYSEDKTRISLAFNTFIKGDINRQDSVALKL